MSTINQGSQEWHELRLGKITASRIADVIAQIKTGEAASRADYRIELVCERLTGKPTESYINADMERGTELEQFARAWYEVKAGIFVKQVAFVDHPSIEMSGASPDGIIDDGLIEIKCPKPSTHVGYLRANKLPTKYIPQVQGCLWITNREWWDFMSYHPAMHDLIVRVYRDDEYINALSEQVIKAVETIEMEVAKWQR